MSFGLSVSDIAGALNLAVKAYRAWHDACGDHADITLELRMLRGHLARAKKDAESPDSLYVKTKEDLDEWEVILEGCEQVVRKLSRVVAKYKVQQDDNSSRRVWARIRQSCANLDRHREKIRRCNTSISTFLDGTTVSALGRMEPKLERVAVQMEEMRSQRHRDASVMTAYSTDDVLQWRQFRRDFRENGFTGRTAARYGDRILEYVHGLMKEDVSAGADGNHASVSASLDMAAEDPIVDESTHRPMLINAKNASIVDSPATKAVDEEDSASCTVALQASTNKATREDPRIKDVEHKTDAGTKELTTKDKKPVGVDDGPSSISSPLASGPVDGKDASVTTKTITNKQVNLTSNSSPNEVTRKPTSTKEPDTPSLTAHTTAPAVGTALKDIDGRHSGASKVVPDASNPNGEPRKRRDRQQKPKKRQTPGERPSDLANTISERNATNPKRRLFATCEDASDEYEGGTLVRGPSSIVERSTCIKDFTDNFVLSQESKHASTSVDADGILESNTPGFEEMQRAEQCRCFTIYLRNGSLRKNTVNPLSTGPFPKYSDPGDWLDKHQEYCPAKDVPQEAPPPAPAASSSLKNDSSKPERCRENSSQARRAKGRQRTKAKDRKKTSEWTGVPDSEPKVEDTRRPEWVWVPDSDSNPEDAQHKWTWVPDDEPPRHETTPNFLQASYASPYTDAASTYQPYTNPGYTYGNTACQYPNYHPYQDNSAIPHGYNPSYPQMNSTHQTRTNPRYQQHPHPTGHYMPEPSPPHTAYDYITSRTSPQAPMHQRGGFHFLSPKDIFASFFKNQDRLQGDQQEDVQTSGQTEFDDDVASDTDSIVAQATGPNGHTLGQFRKPGPKLKRPNFQV